MPDSDDILKTLAPNRATCTQGGPGLAPGQFFSISWPHTIATAATGAPVRAPAFPQGPGDPTGPRTTRHPVACNQICLLLGRAGPQRGSWASRPVGNVMETRRQPPWTCWDTRWAWAGPVPTGPRGSMTHTACCLEAWILVAAVLLCFRPHPRTSKASAGEEPPWLLQVQTLLSGIPGFSSRSASRNSQHCPVRHGSALVTDKIGGAALL